MAIEIVSFPINSMVIFHSFVSPLTISGTHQTPSISEVMKIPNLGEVQKPSNQECQDTSRRHSGTDIANWKPWPIEIDDMIVICLLKSTLNYVKKYERKTCWDTALKTCKRPPKYIKIAIFSTTSKAKTRLNQCQFSVLGLLHIPPRHSQIPRDPVLICIICYCIRYTISVGQTLGMSTVHHGSTWTLLRDCRWSLCFEG